MKAVVFVHTPDGETFGEPVEGPDCLSRARALRESIEEDWPGSIITVAGDEEAIADYKERFMAELRSETVEIRVEDGNG